jgi:tetratricopeptide (TPR) repeat protein
MGNSSLIKIVAVFIGLMILGGNSYGTYQRNKVWSSDENLWYDVSIKSPKNGRGLMNYGLAKMRRGEYQVAIDYYTRAFSTDYGNHPYLSLNMAICQNAIGNQELAKKYYEESIQKGSSYPDCHYFYAQWLLKNGDVSKASYHLSEVLRLSPGHEHAKTLFDQLSMGADARLKQMEELAVKEPTAANYLTLSLEYYRLTRFTDCIATCEKAIAIQPNYAEAYNNICAAYNELKQYEKGAEACEKALAIDPTYQLAKNNLNWSKTSLNK